MDFYDVAIVGAGFAGLSCAEGLSKNGMSVVLFDKKKDLSHHIHTTGIIVDEALSEWDIDPHHLKSLNHVKVFLPNLKSLQLQSSNYNFYLTNTGAVLNDKLYKIQHLNLKVMLNSFVKKIEYQNGVYEFPEFNLKTKFLVIANGANSPFLKKFNFETHGKFLAGYELEFSYQDYQLDPFMNVFIHPKICKGYIGWVIPGPTAIQVGLAVNRGQDLSMENFLNHIDPIFKFDKSLTIGSRSGLIPVGHTSEHVFKNNCLVIGDAAGYVSPLTAGGIHTAMRYGKKGAELILQLSESDDKRSIQILNQYQKDIPKFKFKHKARNFFNLMNKNVIWNILYWTGSLYLMARVIFFYKKRLK